VPASGATKFHALWAAKWSRPAWNRLPSAPAFRRTRWFWSVNGRPLTLMAAGVLAAACVKRS